MKIYFENSMGEKREIGSADKISEAHQIISDFLKNANYKSYYRRMWLVSEGLCAVDVGSHSELFFIEGYNEPEGILGV